MNRFIRLSLLAATALTPLAAKAQSTTSQQVQDGMLLPAGSAGCINGLGPCWVPYSATNPLQVAGSFSSTVGGFIPAGAGTQLSASTTASVNVAVAGPSVLVSNTGTNPAYVTVGNGSTAATTASVLIPASSIWEVTLGTATNLAAISTGGATNLNLQNGSGLFTGMGGGGSSGGGGGNVTIVGPLGQAAMAASVPVAIASNQSNVPVSQGTTTALNAQVVGVGAVAAPAGGVLSIQGAQANGYVTVSQTVTTSLNAQVVGVGTAGTAAGGVVTVQGVAGGTNQPVSQATTASLQATVQVTNAGNNAYVTPASTGAGATNSALVVAISPNNAVTISASTTTSLNAQVVGIGTAGTPAGGVLSIQGVTGGTNQAVAQGTTTALNAQVVGVGVLGTPAGGVVSVQGPASGGGITVSQATTASLQATVQVTNAGNNAYVTPASTNPSATNSALVVAISPNGQLTDNVSSSGITESAIAARAQTAESTVTATNSAQPAMDLARKMLVMPYANKELMLRGNGSASSASAATLIASQTGSHIYVTGLQCFRTDVGTASLYVTLNDTMTTGVASQFPVPAGGGGAFVLATPLVVATLTALTFSPSVATTSVLCNAQGYSGS